MVKPILFGCLLFLPCFYNGPVYGQSAQTENDSAGIVQDSSSAQADEEILSIKPFLSEKDSLPAPVSLRQVEDDRVRAYQRDPDFAYANDPAYWTAKPADQQPSPVWKWLGGLIGSRVTRFVIFLLLLVFVVYAIYRLVKENSFRLLQHRPKKGGTKTDATAPEEQSGEDIDKAIIQFTQTGDFGLAVRYMYIRLIRTALEKNILQFKSSSTNTEIVETFKDPTQARDFRYLASAYEYIFYGGFLPAPEQFTVLQQKFNAFHQHMQD